MDNREWGSHARCCIPHKAAKVKQEKDFFNSTGLKAVLGRYKLFTSRNTWEHLQCRALTRNFLRSLSVEEWRACRQKETHGKWLQQPVESQFKSTAFHPAMFPLNTFILYFIKQNAVIPHSAAVERLFSLRNEILRPNRALLSNKHFEMLTFLKENQIPRSLSQYYWAAGNYFPLRMHGMNHRFTISWV